jgi:dimeric dUTPase (all-alpha-NTP-PPase superfamily)
MNNVHNMLELQDRMNTRVNPRWREAGYAWLRAVAVEGVEALESVGWKWWKKQNPDIQNIKLELVDIWHFILSEAITQYGDKAAEAIAKFSLNTNLAWSFDGFARREYDVTDLDTRERWELLIGFAALRAPLPQIYTLFRSLMVDVGMSVEELYQGYVSKNVLNFFRQDHGYKDGTYVKDWAGEEDNVVMQRLASELTAEGDFSESNLYTALADHYAAVLEARKLAGDDGASDNSYALKA